MITVTQYRLPGLSFWRMEVLLLSLGQRTLMSGFRYEPFSGRSYCRSLVRGWTLPVPREPRSHSKTTSWCG